MNWLHEAEDDLKSLSDYFFDDLINLIDFPLEESDITDGEGDWNAKFQDLEPPPIDMFPSKVGLVAIQKTMMVPILKHSGSSEALSSINCTIHHSSSPPHVSVSKLFQSSSPVSVLESSDGVFSPRNSPSQILAFPVKGMRSKRKRPTTLRFRCLYLFEPSKPEKLTPGESEAETFYPFEKHKILLASHTVSLNSEANYSDGIIRKCTHCETTKTPQWRKGPNGPKTLCNACGVRFRSGRLVPEYRPASSPTFIPSVHSNLHRKIIEMRRKDDD